MERVTYLEKIEAQFRVHSVCALLGPRQVGKTTLARMYASRHPSQEVVFFDLENPLDLARLANPLLAFANYKNQLIVIDEIQRLPDLFPVLRFLVDEPNTHRQFLILGSASRDLIRQSSETLSGRIGYLELSPFSLDEITQNKDLLWLRGGFPRAFLATTNEDSNLWRQSYITTFLERDIPNLGFLIPPQHIRRFWLMLSHYHGQLFNASEIARSLTISSNTVRSYLDILTGTFMIRTLTPWFENISKRQVKSPKIYFKDSGILHSLLGIQNSEQLDIYPKLGASWEGYCLEEIIRHFHATPEECYFWATQSGAELDLLILKNGKRIGFEVKYSDHPKITASMKIALNDLKLDQLYITIPGSVSFPLEEKIQVVGLENLKQITL